MASPFEIGLVIKAQEYSFSNEKVHADDRGILEVVLEIWDLLDFKGCLLVGQVFADNKGTRYN